MPRLMHVYGPFETSFRTSAQRCSNGNLVALSVSLTLSGLDFGLDTGRFHLSLLGDES